MKTLSLIFKGILSLVLLSTFSCKDSDELVVELSTDTTEVIFNPGEAVDSKSFKITSNTDWEIAFNAPWLTLTPSEGTSGDTNVEVTILDMLYKEARSVDIKIMAGDQTKLVTVSQVAYPTPTSLTISAPLLKLVAGQQMQLTVSSDPEVANIDDLSWESSDPLIAEIDFAGNVSAVAPGPVTITATAGGVSASTEIEIVDVFSTDGTKKAYTFADLAGYPSSGVTKDGSTYTLSASITLSESDTLKLGDATTVKLADKVEILAYGHIDFTPESPAVVTVTETGVIPDPIRMTGDLSSGDFDNITFKGVTLRSYTTLTLNVSNCTFTEVIDSEECIDLGGSGIANITNCRFIQNAYPAISSGSNMAVEIHFNDNYLENNSNDARNRPQINITVAGDRPTEIKNNTITGPFEITTCGGIAVSNLLGIGGTNKVTIEGNSVSGCRYGITTNGTMDVRIVNNTITDNNWESNPMYGGSGISIYNSNGGQKVYIEGNTISGNYWGITNIGSVANGTGADVNVGNLTQGTDYNPGNNTFSNNGNNGSLYDLYNSSAKTVYAQGNRWNDQANIEASITHKVDDPSLGEVIFTPAAE